MHYNQDNKNESGKGVGGDGRRGGKRWDSSVVAGKDQKELS